MKTILIFIDSLLRGGAARVTCTQCHQMIKRGYNVHVATNTKTNSIFYEMPNEVVLHEFHVQKYDSNIWSSLKMNYGYCRVARKIIKQVKPDVIIGVEPRAFLYAKVGNIGYCAPVIASEHTSLNNPKRFSLINRLIRKYVYKTASAVTILTRKDAKFVGDRLPQKVVIYNPLSFPIIDKPTNRDKNILCVGRLNDWYIKGFDSILNCWQSLANQYPEWILEIAGDGNAKETNFLQKLIEERGLTKRVILLGQVKNIQQKYAGTTIFALPSRVEGFPMVLMEAMSQGCACIAFDVEGAVPEMVTDNVDGIIIPDGDTAAFTKGIKTLIDNKDLRDKLSQNALVSIQRFSPSNFMDSWETLINKVTSN